MKSSFNKTIIFGRLCADPKLKSHDSDKPFTSFRISNCTVTPNGDEDVQTHKIAAFGKQAMIIVDNLRKGDLCCIEGRLDQKTYDDGLISTIIVAEKITFLSRRRREVTVEQEEV